MESVFSLTLTKNIRHNIDLLLHSFSSYILHLNIEGCLQYDTISNCRTRTFCTMSSRPPLPTYLPYHYLPTFLPFHYLPTFLPFHYLPTLLTTIYLPTFLSTSYLPSLPLSTYLPSFPLPTYLPTTTY